MCKNQVPLLFGLIFCYSQANAIVVTQTIDTQALLQSSLADYSNNIDAFYDGDSAAVGTYSNKSNQYNIGSGIVLSTGSATDYSDGTNNTSGNTTSFGTSGDSKLTAIAGYNTYDASRFGFDFQATSNTVSFDFIFGSDEYPEYVNSSFNDTFGVFVTDKKTGKVEQVSFDNNGNSVGINSAFMSAGSNGELDGTTGLLRTETPVLKGQNYSIEFSIADAGDSVVDSTVFISNITGVSEAVSPIDTYGLFIGISDYDTNGVDGGKGLDGSKNANVVANSFNKQTNVNSDNLEINTTTLPEPSLWNGLIENKGFTGQSILNDIQKEISKVDNNDLFILYVSGHGMTNLFDKESQVISVGTIINGYLPVNGYLTDDGLAMALEGYEDVNKLILLDSCNSGGFWEELSQVPNTTLIASSAKDKLSYSFSDETLGEEFLGRSIFSTYLESAFNKVDGEYFLSDGDNDGSISVKELSSFVKKQDELYIPFMKEKYDRIYSNGIYLAANEYTPYDSTPVLLESIELQTFSVSNNNFAGFIPSSSNTSSKTFAPTVVSEPPVLSLMLSGFLLMVRRKYNI